MNEKDNESSPNIEDKDYGFPFVEVTPIQVSIVLEKKEKIETIQKNTTVSDKENSIISGIPKPSEPTLKIKSDKKVTRKAKSQLPLLLSLVFLIVIILGSIAYFLYYLPESNSNPDTSGLIVSDETVVEAPMSDEIDNVDPDMGKMEDEGTNTEAENDIPEVVSIPEIVTAEIIVVDRRGEIPLYNVVVASSPNERIARAEAQKMIDKGKTAWIIFPFGNTNSYRISVGRYEDLESATKAMEIARVELNESSWILKY